MFTESEIEAMRSSVAYDPAGSRIGSIADVYLDDTTGQPTWITIATGLLGLRVHFVPVPGSTLSGRRLTLPISRDAILSAPRLAEDEHLDAGEEAMLYAHYGLGLPGLVPDGAHGPTPDAEPIADPDQAAPASVDHDLEAQLRHALAVEEEAKQVARLADPLGDGSYAGDASKAGLIDTDDLEAHDHAANDAAHDHAASDAAHDRAAHHDAATDEADHA